MMTNNRGSIRLEEYDFIETSDDVLMRLSFKENVDFEHVEYVLALMEAEIGNLGPKFSRQKIRIRSHGATAFNSQVYTISDKP